MKPYSDYRNSIKESISAVEAICRDVTEEVTLGKALNKLEESGIIIPRFIKSAFDKLYFYSNDPKTGIRHALMDETSGAIPKKEEAYYMLITCSAFVNYINQKRSK